MQRRGVFSPYLLLKRICTHSLRVLMSSVSRMKESHFSAGGQREAVTTPRVSSVLCTADVYWSFNISNELYFIVALKI